MTEEIIIDGINVAGCKDFLEPDGCDNTDTLSMTCSRNNNCYYKQLKRLEQENERLDNEAQDYHNTIMKLDDLIKELEQENKQMKSALEEIREDIKYFYSTEDASNDYKLLTIIDKIDKVLQ